jgi:CDP-glucose 4,6-dehydratase
MEKLVNPGFWNGRRVFLTGHTGFKGGWLSATLKGWGAELHGYALAPVEGGIYQRAGGDDLMASSTIADIRDLETLSHALQRSQAEVVIHMAAQPLVRLSYATPVETYAVNVMGTVNLLEAARGLQAARALVVVTSDKCYENREWPWGYRENEAMGGYDPYSNSKGCAELVTAAYRQSFFKAGGAAVGSGRAGNVIGGGDLALDRLVPDLVRAFTARETTAIRYPNATRPWQHVLEPLSGYLQLAQALHGDNGAAFADGWNFGPASSGERTVGEVADAGVRAWGPGAAWEHVGGEYLHEAGYLKLDSSKARAQLGWAPRWDFENTIAQTIDWYRAATDPKADMAAFTRTQIDSYFNSQFLA